MKSYTSIYRCYIKAYKRFNINITLIMNIEGDYGGVDHKDGCYLLVMKIISENKFLVWQTSTPYFISILFQKYLKSLTFTSSLLFIFYIWRIK